MLFSLDETFKKKKKIQALLLDLGFSMLSDIILLQGKTEKKMEKRRLF